MPAVLSSLTFGSSSRKPLIAAKNFATSATIAAMALPILRRSRSNRLRLAPPNGSSPAAPAWPGAVVGTCVWLTGATGATGGPESAVG